MANNQVCAGYNSYIVSQYTNFGKSRNSQKLEYNYNKHLSRPCSNKSQDRGTPHLPRIGIYNTFLGG